MNRMMADVDQMHNQVKDGYDDLAEIRRLINVTETNMDHHQKTVSHLRTNLEYMNENGKDFEENLNKKSYWKNSDQYSLVSAGASMKMQKPRRINHYSANKPSSKGSGFR
jgi:hypothetical protein